MTVSSAVGSRIAGKVLGDYLGSIGKGAINLATGLGSKIGGLVSDVPLIQQIGSGTAEEAAKAIVSNPILKRAAAVVPASVGSWQQGAQALPGIAKGLGTAAGLYGGYQLLSALANSADQQSGRAAPFATQQYYPGSLSLTNEQAGEMMLNQQRYLQQMQLIQARQFASQPQNPYNQASLSDALSKTYTFG